MAAKGGRICLHTGTWVFHYKGSTIPYALGNQRQTFNVVQQAAAHAAAHAGSEAADAVREVRSQDVDLGDLV